MPRTPLITERQARYATVAAALLGLFLCLRLGLLGALLAGLLVHELVHAIAPHLPFGGRGKKRARVLSVGLIAALVIGALVAAAFGAVELFRSDGASPAVLLARMADILSSSRASLPEWIGQYLPEDAEALRQAIADWLRAHARELELAGRSFGIGVAHILVGMVIGAIICFREEAYAEGERSLLLSEGGKRVRTLAHAFRSVVFAQVKISAVNTTLTAIYLAVVLPLLGVHLPFTKAMIVVTFFAGLLPVVGNLISNSVIVVVSLSVSFALALGSLGFLVLVHKLEYFLNARIVGGEIRASAWEILCAMLVLETAFGLPGLIAAPVFYAYVKAELRQLGLI
jgi:predicted PurR-regulated permease PerM